MPAILRILDANANRAREALRVMEEAARFVLDDAQITEGLKRLRHELAAALSMVDGLEANRDTPNDVGTTIKTAREATRNSVADVVIAAGKRLGEALRAIEEYGKTLGERAPGFASSVEAIRYRGYDLEQKLNRAMGSGAPKQWRLCVLISQELCRERDWWRVATAAVEGGADCIQLREKTMDAGELLSRAIRLVGLCRPRGVSVIINDRPDVALLSGADGVHLGQSDLPCAEARRVVGTQLIIGVSTSALDQARQALRDGADYCGIGPMFPTTTKVKDIIVGTHYAKEYLAWNKLPHLAIGGITPTNLRELTAAGVRGIAVSSAVCSAFDPAAVVRDMLSVMQNHEHA